MEEVEGRRIRRFVPQRLSRRRLLPLHSSSSSSSNISNTVSCCYCDYKISSFNIPLFLLGRRYSRFFKIWFSIGVGFGVSALFGVSVILLWELARTLQLLGGGIKLGNFASTWLFGLPPLVPGLSLSLADVGYACVSTIISVSVHEFGHAVAATSSEGIQIEYIAIFIAILFPGALVAYELFQNVPYWTGLRVYSAGIWHNAVCCAACGLALFFLPLILFPFYTSGHNPKVLNVPPTSPLSGYLAPGDVILSIDDVTIRNSQEWLKLNTLTYNVKLNNVNLSHRTGELETVNKMKGYCVPSFMMEEIKITKWLGNQHVCPGELTAFVKLCSANVTLHDGQNKTDLLNIGRSMYCINAKDVVKRNRCGDDRGLATLRGGGCTCLQDEFCLAPVQEPGLVWVEIAYSSPSHECLSHEQNRFPFSKTSGVKATNCGGTFIFVGDVVSMAHSIKLTSYQPRWGPQIVAYFPSILERILIWTFHTSLALALFNALPVYLLDGEYILDATLSYSTSLSSRKRKKVLRVCLFCGSLFSIIVCFRELLQFYFF
ncbi:membrane-bound transcription factor site-2 protease homolog isoform X1 [Vigna umbellata]|uniref:membrane-bound transcription factor site-2 protease homolog isoform X1 n=1 Tax=Vigna umbellata TaxID=87088 RepID=UPI001F5F4D4B|nr:membrane-bound transcription factor site-2 protease homolog isoform X1 [Vigna umbellata]